MKLDFKSWVTEWKDKRDRAPWELDVHIDDNFKEGDIISVFISPYTILREIKRCYNQPRYKDKGYELPFCLFNERLTKSTANKLKTALCIIQKMQGIEFEQCISFLSLVILIYFDFSGALKGKKSILEGLQENDLPNPDSNKIAEKMMNKPRASLEKVLDFWDQFGGRLSGGFLIKPTDILGVPDYSTIPPYWLTIDEYKKLYGDSKPLPKITTTIDPIELQLLPDQAEKILKLLDEGAKRSNAPKKDFIAPFNPNGYGTPMDIRTLITKIPVSDRKMYRFIASQSKKPTPLIIKITSGKYCIRNNCESKIRSALNY